MEKSSKYHEWEVCVSCKCTNLNIYLDYIKEQFLTTPRKYVVLKGRGLAIDKVLLLHTKVH